MKIMMVITGMKSGGAERVMATLCNELSSRHEVRLLVIKGDHSDYSLSECADVVYGGLTNNNIFTSTLLVKKQYEEWKPEIVLAFMNKTAIVALLARKISAYKPKIVGAERANPYNSDKIVRVLRKCLYPSADGFVFQTKQAQEYYKDILKCSSVVLKNPLNPDFKVVPYDGVRSPKIVCVGRLSIEKNQRLLIDAFSMISYKYPEYKVEFYGDGPLKEELNNYIVEAGLSEKVYLMGRKDNIQQYIRDAAIFVLPSKSEGMPNALLEAMALGIPSIATDCPIGGSAVIVDDGVNGFLIPMNDTKNLSEKISVLIENEDLAKKYSVEARKVLANFNTEKVCFEWEEYLKKINRGK